MSFFSFGERECLSLLTKLPLQSLPIFAVQVATSIKSSQVTSKTVPFFYSISLFLNKFSYPEFLPSLSVSVSVALCGRSERKRDKRGKGKMGVGTSTFVIRWINFLTMVCSFLLFPFLLFIFQLILFLKKKVLSLCVFHFLVFSYGVPKYGVVSFGPF